METPPVDSCVDSEVAHLLIFLLIKKFMERAQTEYIHQIAILGPKYTFLTFKQVTYEVCLQLNCAKRCLWMFGLKVKVWTSKKKKGCSRKICLLTFFFKTDSVTCVRVNLHPPWYSRSVHMTVFPFSWHTMCFFFFFFTTSIAFLFSLSLYSLLYQSICIHALSETHQSSDGPHLNDWIQYRLLSA